VPPEAHLLVLRDARDAVLPEGIAVLGCAVGSTARSRMRLAGGGAPRRRSRPRRLRSTDRLYRPISEKIRAAGHSGRCSDKAMAIPEWRSAPERRKIAPQCPGGSLGRPNGSPAQSGAAQRTERKELNADYRLISADRMSMSRPIYG